MIATHHVDSSVLSRYNGFYLRPDCREIVFRLYKGECQASQAKIAITEAHVGHIVPQAASGFFTTLYPTLDVHNIVNLQLIKASLNLRAGDYFIADPLPIQYAISWTSRLVLERLPKLLEQNAPKRVTDLMRAAKTCLSADLTHRGTDHTHMSIYRYVLEHTLDHKAAMQSYNEYRKFAVALGIKPETAGNYRRWLKFAGTRAAMIQASDDRQRLERQFKRMKRDIATRKQAAAAAS